MKEAEQTHNYVVTRSEGLCGSLSEMTTIQRGDLQL